MWKLLRVILRGARDVIHTPDNLRGPGTLLLLNDGDVSMDIYHEAVLTHVVSVASIIQLSPRLDNLEQLLKISSGSYVNLESPFPAFNTFSCHSADLNSTVIGECFHCFIKGFVQGKEFGQNKLVEVTASPGPVIARMIEDLFWLFAA